ncbi:MAG: endonuclease/exonuclease/phosphatase family protein [Candidatus Omnitrophica bacterium]|nr:endonuclease/exonuclease/phosphatase family protein [Candidatus Omnitrophota bacterium]
MKWLTFNTWGTRGPEHRRKVLLKALRALEAEILCLQEVTDPSLLDELSYPTRHHAPESGLAVLSRFPSSAHRLLTYRAASPLELHGRQALLVELKVESAPLWVVNTHLSWRKEEEAVRTAQAEELLREIRSLEGIVLLGGDFNAEAQRPSVLKILEGGFSDLFARLNPGNPGITWDNGNPFIQSHLVRFPDRRIDYLFISEESFRRISPVRCEVALRGADPDGTHPSDHYGVLGTLDLNSR